MAEPPQDPDQRSYHEAARAWFAKGDGDLRSAVALLELDPHAVEVRYPFAGEPPTQEEAREAVEYARMVRDRVRAVTFPEEAEIP